MDGQVKHSENWFGAGIVLPSACKNHLQHCTHTHNKGIYLLSWLGNRVKGEGRLGQRLDPSGLENEGVTGDPEDLVGLFSQVYLV